MAHASGALRTRDLARITVDTTVQPKNIAFPTDVKMFWLDRHRRVPFIRLLTDRPYTIYLTLPCNTGWFGRS